MNEKENSKITGQIADMLADSDLIFRIGKNKTFSEKLQLLVLKLLILIWEHGDTEVLDVMKQELSLIDDIRHELTFIRARLYKRILENKSGLTF